MRKTKGMLLVEAQAGRDVRDLIIEKVHDLGSVADAADAMGLTDKGLRNWIEELDGRVGTEIVFDGYVPQVAATTLEPVPA